ncbi:hypothetical protein FNV65_54840 [Streptomyces sp. S1A1-8]|uniref:FUSC family protein n=1 Tax=unclassified Streptomyces TaxID=2593676 RepID=UPI001162444A|nr:MULTISPECIES: FUSC family protein [unclassified Streptomyces]QDO25655.1 hypothetical protein FNV65_54840 [Streptomyces sp. S1A1-8]QDO35772.1 hypothetical protein FNV63_54860 [Streptomyces sp. S1A1-3]
MTRRVLGKRAVQLFSPVPGSRPAVVGGLVNGIAIGAPLLVGIVASAPGVGATATLGAYVAAFTNQGGARLPRTRGLLVAAAVDAAAFWIGASVATLFPVALVVLAVLVFLAAMGSSVHATVARLGMMPATALLAAAGEGSGTGAGMRFDAVWVLLGGVWYAAATVLTPSPRLRDLLDPIAQPYRVIARNLRAVAGTPADVTRPQTAGPLRRAEAATRTLRSPRGDEHLADVTDPLVRHATALADLTTALAVTGPPPAAIAAPYAAITARASERLTQIDDCFTLRRPPADLEADTFFARLETACDRMRAQAAAGEQAYADVARAARQRRLLARITTTIATARKDADALPSLAATPLPTPPAPGAPLDMARLRSAMTLTSPTYRHALRATTVSAAVLVLVHVAHLSHGAWATLAVLRVLRPQYSITRERVAQRVIGNLVGGVSAALLIAAVHQPTAIALILFAIITAGFTLRPVNYAFWVVFGTPLVLLLGTVNHPGDWLDALVRIAMTVLGTAAALLGSRLLWPSWEHPRLTDHASRARQATAAYLDAVLRSLPRPDPDADLHPARLTADKAVARARTTARHARHEPGHDPAALARLTTSVDALSALLPLIAALATYSTPRTARIPAMASYTDHAAPALTSFPGEERATHDAALVDALDEMSLYREELHIRRHRELVTGRSGPTGTRTAIREHDPVIELLHTIAATIHEAGRDEQPADDA